MTLTGLTWCFESMENLRFRQVIARQAPGWAVTLHGPGLPDHGAKAEVGTLAEAHEALNDLLRLLGEGDASTVIEYDLGPEINAMLDTFKDALVALRKAMPEYASAGHLVAQALATQGVLLRDAADVMSVPFWTVARLQAEEPAQHDLVHFHRPGVRHQIREHIALELARAAAAAARQAVSIASRRPAPRD